jgi:hypothetical protein
MDVLMRKSIGNGLSYRIVAFDGNHCPLEVIISHGICGKDYEKSVLAVSQK